MCGINGFTFNDKEKILEMNKLLFHRGPDSSGTFCNEISLGHTRLKIIDLSENAAQPMSDSENKIQLTFNGEIYNFKELKNELEREGYKFKSNSDTEVIIYAYKKWGYDCVNHFNGMWAFALYDQEKNKLFLSRDRFGKKPLFYTIKNNDLIFSSEIKPLFIHNIEKKLNKKAVSSFFSYRYVLGEETMFENIFKLLPANNLIFDLQKKEIEKIWQYWDLDQRDIKISEQDAEKQTEDLLKNAVLLRQVSDVPIGTTNSGGLDSSVVSAIMASLNKERIRTFTVKFPERDFDEAPYARLLAERYNTIHKETQIDINNFLELMKEYTKKKDQPIGIPNEIASYLLFREIKKDVTVILSGDGADEIFAGYGRIFRSPDDYEKLKNLEKTPELYPTNYPSLYKKYRGKFFKDELEHFMFLYNYFPDEEKNFILRDECKQEFTPLFKKYFDKIKGEYAKKISYVFLRLHIQEPLANRDNSSMASSVELRCPYFDYNLANFAFNLPFEFKNPWKSKEHEKNSEFKSSDEIAEEDDIPKYLLKKIAEKYISKEIIYRKKIGFWLPMQKWFKEELFEEAEKLLFSEDSKIKLIANTENLKTWIENGIKSSDKDFGQRLWMLVSLELWLREWF